MPYRRFASCPPVFAGRSARGQRGIATLVVVALLFFVMSLTAAYTARNLIFEQRISAQQYRATQTFDTSEAGLEWALSMLNTGRIDAACQPTADVTQTSFRERYLSIDPDTGVVTRRLRSDGSTPLWAACQFDGSDWVCSCPTDDVPSVTLAPAGQGLFPAFAVRFVPVVGFAPARPGLIRVEANGCTSFDVDCLTRLLPAANNTPCRTNVCAMVALSSGLKLPPAAPVTVHGDVTAAALTIVNDDRSSYALTLHAGRPIPIADQPMLVGPAGTPSQSTLSVDPELGGLPQDATACAFCLFTSVFGARPEVYRDQQAVVEIDCSTTPCDVATLTAAIAAHPGRPLWLTGAAGLRLDTAAALGDADAPVTVIVEGPIEATAAVQLTGFLYGLDLFPVGGTPGVELGGGARIVGGLASASTLDSSGPAEAVYDGAVLQRLRLTTGSFVRVPGSWRDFQ